MCISHMLYLFCLHWNAVIFEYFRDLLFFFCTVQLTSFRRFERFLSDIFCLFYTKHKSQAKQWDFEIFRKVQQTNFYSELRLGCSFWRNRCWLMSCLLMCLVFFFTSFLWLKSVLFFDTQTYGWCTHFNNDSHNTRTVCFVRRTLGSIVHWQLHIPNVRAIQS